MPSLPKGQRREQSVSHSENLQETRGKLFSWQLFTEGSPCIRQCETFSTDSEIVILNLYEMVIFLSLQKRKLMLRDVKQSAH